MIGGDHAPAQPPAPSSMLIEGASFLHNGTGFGLRGSDGWATVPVAEPDAAHAIRSAPKHSRPATIESSAAVALTAENL